MAQTLGQYLLNSALPKGNRFEGPVSAKELQKTLANIAKEDPHTYVKAVTEVKRLGDEFATVEGISVGLDDIAPNYAARDPVMRETLQKMQKETDPDKRRELLMDTQAKLKSMMEYHPGDLALMAKSGGRGNANQLMKTVSSPVAVTNAKGEVVPWLIARSYSEGLRPSESWVAGDEARRSVIEGKTEVTEPGEVGKLLISSMMDQVVTKTDCGTMNGIPVSTGDGADMLDRYLARDAGGFPRNTLIDGRVASELKKKVGAVVVRSPLTCQVHRGGVCQKCMGLSERGQAHTVGTNVGVRSAQALSEPLTQFTLSAKHGTRLASGKNDEPGGIEAVKSLLEVPKSFLHAATLATKAGKVEAIHDAPQGGKYVKVGGTEHYVPPDLRVHVHLGEPVEAGDALSDGIPKPDDVVKYKGLGVGRKYLVDKMHNVYKRAGVDIDKRHLELMSKSHLNYVEVDGDDEGEFIRGDTVHQADLRERLERDAVEMPVVDAEGKTLAEDCLQYSAGTVITPAVIAQLKHLHPNVKVAKNPPKFTPVMHSLSRSPLYKPDWLAKMSHRYLKDTLLEGARLSQQSDIHSTNPVPAFVFGTEFGKGGGGAY